MWGVVAVCVCVCVCVEEQGSVERGVRVCGWCVCVCVWLGDGVGCGVRAHDMMRAWGEQESEQECETKS